MDDTSPTRRTIMQTGGAALALAAIGPGALAQAAQTVTGTVYENRSNAAVRQPGDPGVPGVLVSNGREVVKTDAEGRYSLPVDDETIVFVVKPTGYALPRDPQTNLQRFYYVHQPKGTPPELDFRYAGLAPTGPLPAAIDFALTRADEPRAYDVVLLTDPQPESEVEVDFIRDDVIRGLIGVKAAFGITTGDLMFDDLSMYPRYNRIIGSLGLPWWNIGGNHDLNFEAPDDHYAHETYKRTFGPPYYAFEYGGVTYLMLNNVKYLGAGTAKPGQGVGGLYVGEFGEKQLAFVANLLAQTPADRLVVCGMHIPLTTYGDPTGLNNQTADRAAFLKLLGTRPSLSVCGHTHTTEHHYLTDGGGQHHHHVMTAVSGSWWSGPYDHRGVAVADSRDGSPNGFHMLSVDGAKYTTRYVPANEPAAKQMRIMLEGPIHTGAKELDSQFRMGRNLGSPIDAAHAGSTKLVVNVFDGGPKSSVEARIGERTFALKPDRRPDPFVAEVFSRNEATKKPWVKAEVSSHIWTGRLPADLAQGAQTIHVRATDEYGRVHRDHMVLEVAGLG